MFDCMPSLFDVCAGKRHLSFGTYLLNHLTAYGTGFARSQVAVVALLEVYANLVGSLHLKSFEGLSALICSNTFHYLHSLNRICSLGNILLFCKISAILSEEMSSVSELNNIADIFCRAIFRTAIQFIFTPDIFAVFAAESILTEAFANM